MIARLAAATLLFLALTSRATTIDPMLWEELVSGADFVGVVECTEAGGIVARYRVVETWKGTELPGASITIAEAVNYWEPQYPLALVGERSVVTAYRSAAPSRMISTTIGGPVPLWWRDLPSDYGLPLFQGKADLHRGDLHDVGFRGSLAEFKPKVMAFVALDEQGRELAVLKARAAKWGRARDGGDDPQASTFRRIRAASSLTAAAEAIVKGFHDGDEDSRDRLAWFVATSGDRLVRLVQRRPAEQFGPPEVRAALDELLRDMRGEGAVQECAPLPEPPAPAADPPKPSPSELERLAAIVRAGPGEDPTSFEDAVNVLLRHRPEPVVEWLAAWTNPKDHWSDADRGYVLGSSVAVRLGGDRARHLKVLLGAADPFVRAAAAVYLAHEEPTAGRAALRSAMELGGDPGAWCALALARRGDRSAIPRLLSFLAQSSSEESEGGMAGVPHRNLVKRVIELTSNSAAKAGLPQPGASKDPAAAAHAWWLAHPDVTPFDPWMPALEARKID